MGYEALNFWPSEDGDTLSFENLPESADLEYGITLEPGDTYYDGVFKQGDSYFAVVHCSAHYAEKVVEAEPEPEAVAETATEDGGADAPAAEAGGEPAADAGTATEGPPPPENQAQGE